jgi:hypothetical protein
MSIKVKDLAKELEISIDEILDQLRRLYVEVEDESSSVDDKIAGLIRHKFGGVGSPKAKKAKKAKEDADAAEAKAKSAARKVSKKIAAEEAEKVKIEEEKAEKKAKKTAVPEKQEEKPKEPPKKEEPPAPKLPEKPFVSPIRMVKAAVPEKAPGKETR